MKSVVARERALLNSVNESMATLRAHIAALVLLLALASCVRATRGELAPRLTVDEVVELMPEKVKDKEGWARDVLQGFEVNQLRATKDSVCAVLAVVEQESGFEANPAVPNLAAIARRALNAKAEALGPLGKPLLDEVLQSTPPGSKKSFDQRLSSVRTEADLDRLYRDILAEQRRRHPALYAAADLSAKLFSSGDFDDRNPVTTAGSMQVSVRFAEDTARALGKDPDGARDELYTRQGGLTYGIARLLGYPSSETDMLYRFADYNAGFYSSRNAAFQEQLSALTKQKLTYDGDLLAYAPDGDVRSVDTQSMAALKAFGEAHGLSERQLEHDARKEKSHEFERTETYFKLKQAYQQKTGKVPASARLPEVTLHSPKMSGNRSTGWFAQSVERRYQRCLER